MRTRVSIGILILLALGACERQGPLVAVRLKPEGHASASSPDSGSPGLKIAVAPVTSPRETFTSYRRLSAYLESHLQQPVAILHRHTYSEILELLRFGQCDAAFVCTYLYVQGRHQFGLRIVAVPVVDGQTRYYSNIIVPASSPAVSLADLRGQVFAFCDPLSNTGRLAPQYRLTQIDEQPEQFFADTLFTHSHDRSVKMVAEGLVDGAAVHSLVYDAMVARDAGLRASLRVVERIGPFGMPPVVARPDLPAAARDQLAHALLGMDQDEVGKTVLAGLGVDRFAEADEQAYQNIENMARSLGELP